MMIIAGWSMFEFAGVVTGDHKILGTKFYLRLHYPQFHEHVPAGSIDGASY